MQMGCTKKQPHYTMSWKRYWIYQWFKACLPEMNLRKIYVCVLKGNWNPQPQNKQMNNFITNPGKLERKSELILNNMVDTCCWQKFRFISGYGSLSWKKMKDFYPNHSRSIFVYNILPDTFNLTMLILLMNGGSRIKKKCYFEEIIYHRGFSIIASKINFIFSRHKGG